MITVLALAFGLFALIYLIALFCGKDDPAQIALMGLILLVMGGAAVWLIAFVFAGITS